MAMPLAQTLSYSPQQRLRFEGCRRLLVFYRRADNLWMRELLREFGSKCWKAAWHDPRCHRSTPALAALHQSRADAFQVWSAEVDAIEALGSASVVPVGQPVAGVRHAASLRVAAGVTLRESVSEAHGERTGR